VSNGYLLMKCRHSWTSWGRAQLDLALALFCLIFLEVYLIIHKWLCSP